MAKNISAVIAVMNGNNNPIFALRLRQLIKKIIPADQTNQ